MSRVKFGYKTLLTFVGKTTTLNMIIAELAPTKGKVKTMILK
jgi:ABC-type Na+ transport system ATPase subunit NatA